MKTIAQRLKIKKFPFKIEEDGGLVYWENSKGYWEKREFSGSKEIYWENSEGSWEKREFLGGKEVYFESSNGVWAKREFLDGKVVYFEDSDGCIVDKRPKVKELTLEEVAEKFGVEVENLRIKD